MEDIHHSVFCLCMLLLVTRRYFCVGKVCHSRHCTGMTILLNNQPTAVFQHTLVTRLVPRNVPTFGLVEK